MYFSLINIWLCQKKCVTLYIEKRSWKQRQNAHKAVGFQHRSCGKMHPKLWVFSAEAVHIRPRRTTGSAPRLPLLRINIIYSLQKNNNDYEIRKTYR